MESGENLERRIASVAALDQPLRRNVYRVLAERDEWVTRDAVAEALAIPRSVAAFHLDKLAAAAVVEVMFQRTSGRTGPGAGRPSKLYRRASQEISASVPERRYDLAGSLLAAAIAEAERTGKPVAKCLAACAHSAGRVTGQEAGALSGALRTRADRQRVVMETLARHGYEPVARTRGEVVLRNCPFHALAEQHRNLVCGMNHDFLTGLLEGVGSERLQAWLDPQPGYCCVRVKAS